MSITFALVSLKVNKGQIVKERGCMNGAARQGLCH